MHAQLTRPVQPGPVSGRVARLHGHGGTGNGFGDASWAFVHIQGIAHAVARAMAVVANRPPTAARGPGVEHWADSVPSGNWVRERPMAPLSTRRNRALRGARCADRPNAGDVSVVPPQIPAAQSRSTAKPSPAITAWFRRGTVARHMPLALKPAMQVERQAF